MTARKPLIVIDGQIQEIPSGDIIPIAALTADTPDGSKYLKDDNTLGNPGFSSDMMAFAAAQG